MFLARITALLAGLALVGMVPPMQAEAKGGRTGLKAAIVVGKAVNRANRDKDRGEGEEEAEAGTQSDERARARAEAAVAAASAAEAAKLEAKVAAASAPQQVGVVCLAGCYDKLGLPVRN